MHKILVKSLFDSAFSENNAQLLRKEIDKLLELYSTIEIDFTGIEKFTTLFFNFSTGYYISKLGPEAYQKKIKVSGLTSLGNSVYTSSCENAIEKYLPNEAETINQIINNPEEG